MATRRIIVAGLIASVVMGMVEMVLEAVAGSGFWLPVIYIGATVLRGLRSLQPPVGFHFGGVIVGLMGHVMLNLNATLFALAHVMWGAALGWFLPVPAMATSHPSPA